MLLDLLVGELEHLQPVRERRLGSFCLCKVIHNFLVGKSLLNVLVSKVDDHVAIRVGLTANSVLARLVNSLDLSIMTHNLVHYLAVCGCLAVVLWE